jgi:hypothetical protein
MNWEIYDGQNQRGPMPEGEVYAAIRAGLPKNAYVRQAGSPDWIALDKHPVFAAALEQRGAPGQWSSMPPPPPPPAFIGAPQPVVTGPPPGTPYAVSSPNAGQPTRRKAVFGGGCLVQALGVALLLGTFVAPFAGVALMVQVMAGVVGAGLLLVFVGGLLNVRWVCGLCKQPVAGRSVHVCPSCRASFT